MCTGTVRVFHDHNTGRFIYIILVRECVRVQYGYFMIIIPVGLPEAAAKALTGSRLSYSDHSDT